LKLILQLIF